MNDASDGIHPIDGSYLTLDVDGEIMKDLRINEFRMIEKEDILKMEKGECIKTSHEGKEIDIKLIEFKNPIVVSKRISKIVIQKGIGDKTPKFEDRIAFRLEGLLRSNDGLTETVFDELKNIEFKIGEKMISLPLEKAVRSMKQGEISHVTFEEKLLIHILSRPEFHIPENYEAIYRFEIVKIDPAKIPWDCKTYEEHYNQALLRREEGSKYFKDNHLDLAATKYQKALLFLECFGQEGAKQEEILSINKLKSSCLCNLAAITLINKEFEATLIHCNNAIESDPENLKAYYRRGQYYLEKRLWSESEQDFLKILEAEPNNIFSKNALNKAKKGAEGERQKEKAMYKKMTQRLKTEPLYSEIVEELNQSKITKLNVKIVAVVGVIMLFLILVLISQI